MVSIPDPASHVCNLLSQITRDDDGAHRSELLELIDGIADPANEVARAAKNYLESLSDKGCPCENECHCGH